MVHKIHELATVALLYSFFSVPALLAHLDRAT